MNAAKHPDHDPILDLPITPEEPAREKVNRLQSVFRAEDSHLKTMPNPTEEELKHPIFEAIWQTIKRWDVNVPDYYSGYCGANGSHVKLILDAIEPLAKWRSFSSWWMDRGQFIELIEHHNDRCAMKEAFEAGRAWKS